MYGKTIKILLEPKIDFKGLFLSFHKDIFSIIRSVKGQFSI